MFIRALMVAGVALLPLAFGATPARAAFICNTPDCLLPTTTTTTTAGTATTSLRSQSATRFSIGLQMDLYTGEPQLVAAIRHTVTLPHNQVYGGQGDISLPLNLTQPLQMPTIRALGIAGERNVMAMLGGGVVLGSFLPVATAAVQVPYATAGANYVYGRGFQPYAGVNSFARAVAPRVVTTGSAGSSSTSTSCPTGYTLANAASQAFAVGAGVIDSAGKTCVGLL
jgi:hypothetical protein